MLTFHKFTFNQIDALSVILDEAKSLLRAQQIDQWQKGYPNREILAADARAGCGYVLAQDTVPIGLCAVTCEPEASYFQLETGSWLTDKTPYAVIHRMAVGKAGRGKGFASFMFGKVAAMARDGGQKSIRIDTHPGNQAMQSALEKSGFVYCGRIRLADGPEAGDPRLAYELLLI